MRYRNHENDSTEKSISRLLRDLVLKAKVLRFTVYSFMKRLWSVHKAVRRKAQNLKFWALNPSHQQPCCCYSSGFRDVIEVINLDLCKTPSLLKCFTFSHFFAYFTRKKDPNFIVVTT